MSLLPVEQTVQKVEGLFGRSTLGTLGVFLLAGCLRGSGVERRHVEKNADAGLDWSVLAMRTIKCQKGIWWMPWHAQAMKDVIRCDKRRGAANKL